MINKNCHLFGRIDVIHNSLAAKGNVREEKRALEIFPINAILQSMTMRLNAASPGGFVVRTFHVATAS